MILELHAPLESRRQTRDPPRFRIRAATLLPFFTVLLWLPPAALAHHPDHLACAVNEKSAGRLVLRNCAHNEALEVGQEGASEFLEHHSLELGLPNGNADLSVVEEKRGIGRVRTHFQQQLAGLPVYDAYTTVNQDTDGNLDSLYLNYRSLAAGNPVPTWTEVEAEIVARDNAQIVSTRHPTRSELVWYPLANGSARLSWKFMIFSKEPLGDFLTLVDAHSGKVLLQENRIAFDTGQALVYLPNPMQTSGNTSLDDNGDATSPALDSQRVSVTLERLDSGIGTLKGQYVDLVSLTGGLSVPIADEVSRVYAYQRNDPRFEQTTVYHSIDQIQAYIQSLGFSDSVGTPNGIRDFATLANAQWYEEDQSYYSTGDDAVHFGVGGVDDGEDADIIAHEYGHAIQHDQNACWGGGEMNHMGEGFGDYLAASFYAGNGDAAHQAAHSACVGEWDASSYSSANPPCLRRVDGTKTYPADLTGSVHADGEIWSGSLWDIRATLGGPTLDQIVLEHHFNLPCNATMTDAANELIQADQSLNAGANVAVIRAAFCNRGILSGAACSGGPDLNLAQVVSPDPPVAGQNATYTITTANNGSSQLSAIQLSAVVPSGSTFVAASDSGSEISGTVTWPAFDVAAGATVTRSYEVTLGSGGGSVTRFADDMESGSSNWSISHDTALAEVDWSITTDNAHEKTIDTEPRSAKSATCTNGLADVYPCDNVNLHEYIAIGDLGGSTGSDGWGWTDPQSGKEYVLMGRDNGTSFIDISDPQNPVNLGNLPTHSVNSDWRDMKVYADHAFIVSEAAGHGMQVFDLTALRNVSSPPATFANSAHYSGFSTAHNIAINTDTGIAYVVGADVCGSGLYMLDITNPLSPTEVGCYSADGYTHDVQCTVYSGPDTDYTGDEICFASNEDTLTIVNVTTKSSPAQISRTSYAGVGYSHQAWLTPNQQYLLMDDELDEQNNGHGTRTYVWDVSDLDAPVLVGNHTSSLAAIDHNQYVVGDFVYQANYTSGLRVLKIDNLAQASLCEVASFDVFPANNNAVFSGAWNVYPFFASGVVAITAIEGLAIVEPQLALASCGTPPPNVQHAWFASNPDTTADQYLVTANPVSISSETTLSFWHEYDTENNYDGGVAEYSTDGGSSWIDLGDLITQNGYTADTIPSSYQSPIANRRAFEGTSGGWIQTIANLSSLNGQDVLFRFRMSSDTSVSGVGWYIDDVDIGDVVKITAIATVTGGASSTNTLTSNVSAPAGNNDPTLAVNGGITLGEGTSLPIAASALQATDSDPGQTLTFTVTSGPSNGSLSPAGVFTQGQIDASAVEYTHDGSETTSDSFTFTVSDGNGGNIGPAVFSITVTPVNDAPSISISSLPSAQVGTAYNASWITADPDPGDTVSMSVLNAPSWVTGPNQNPDGSWSISGTPSAGDAGSTPVTLRAQDSASPPATTDVILVLEVSSAPAAVPTIGPMAYAALIAGVGLMAHHRLRRSVRFRKRHDR